MERKENYLHEQERRLFEIAWPLDDVQDQLLPNGANADVGRYAST